MLARLFFFTESLRMSLQSLLLIDGGFCSWSLSWSTLFSFFTACSKNTVFLLDPRGESLQLDPRGESLQLTWVLGGAGRGHTWQHSETMVFSGFSGCTNQPWLNVGSLHECAFYIPVLGIIVDYLPHSSHTEYSYPYSSTPQDFIP